VHENVSEGDSTAPLSLLHEVSLRALMVSVYSGLSQIVIADVTRYYRYFLAGPVLCRPQRGYRYHLAAFF
jgi:hypothetical protein